MILGNLSRLFVLPGCGLLLAAGFAPLGCGDDRFSGCEASRTCPPSKGGQAGSGEAGAPPQTGGSSGSRADRGGSSGDDDGGEGGIATGGHAGGTGEGGTGEAGTGDGGSAEPPDTKPPVIVSVSPADGALGVRGDTNLVITFSEPMDRVTTQAAYQSADIPAAGVTFSWNSNSTVLTVDPIVDLPYAEGTAPSSPARQFAISITDTAEDLAGNRLLAPNAWLFSTLRRVTQSLASAGTWTVDYMSNREECQESVGIGDDGRAGVLGVVAFNFGDVPAGVAEWESAVLAGRQTGVQGTPYGSTRLGVLRAYSMGAAEPSSIMFGTPVVRDLGVFSSASTAGVRMIGALDAVIADYAEAGSRGAYSMYRLSFERGQTADTIIDSAVFECTFTLTLSYIII